MTHLSALNSETSVRLVASCSTLTAVVLIRRLLSSAIMGLHNMDSTHHVVLVLANEAAVFYLFPGTLWVTTVCRTMINDISSTLDLYWQVLASSFRELDNLAGWTKLDCFSSLVNPDKNKAKKLDHLKVWVNFWLTLCTHLFLCTNRRTSHFRFGYSSEFPILRLNRAEGMTLNLNVYLL